jgi:hypothetical protein
VTNHAAVQNLYCYTLLLVQIGDSMMQYTFALHVACVCVYHATQRSMYSSLLKGNMLEIIAAVEVVTTVASTAAYPSECDARGREHVLKVILKVQQSSVITLRKHHQVVQYGCLLVKSFSSVKLQQALQSEACCGVLVQLITKLKNDAQQLLEPQRQLNIVTGCFDESTSATQLLHSAKELLANDAVQCRHT